MNKNSKQAMALMVLLGAQGSVYAGGCADYPYASGDITAVMTEAGVKILATGAADVDFDDTDEVQDAMMEAELEAKASISHFFNEEISSDKSVETAATKKVKMVKGASGSTKDVTIEKLKTTLKKFSSNSKSLLRGVIKLSSCYEKGQKVLVSVGLKPETIAAAESATGMISESINRQPTATRDNLRGSSSGASEGTGNSRSSGASSNYGMNNPEGFSRGLDRLKDF